MNRTVLADVRPLGSDLYDYDEQREGYQPYEEWITKKAEKEAKNEAKIAGATSATAVAVVQNTTTHSKTEGIKGEIKVTKPIHNDDLVLFKVPKLTFREWICTCERRLRNGIRHPELASLYTVRNEKWIWGREGRLHAYFLRVNRPLTPQEVNQAKFPHLDKVSVEWAASVHEDMPRYIQNLIQVQQEQNEFKFIRAKTMFDLPNNEEKNARNTQARYGAIKQVYESEIALRPQRNHGRSETFRRLHDKSYMSSSTTQMTSFREASRIRYSRPEGAGGSKDSDDIGKRRPSLFNHLPPLTAPKSSVSDFPRILESGPYTHARPLKEQRHYRSVSDSIGNNFSPYAKDLSVLKMQEKISVNRPSPSLIQLRIDLYRRNKENIKGKELPAVFSISPPNKGQERFGSKSPILPPISGEDGRPSSSTDHLPHVDSLPLQSIVEATNQRKVKIYKTQESDKREVTFAGTDSVQLVTIQAKPKPGIHREYDQFTLACLAIQFPSAETKTEGIPKVSVPHPDMEERYFHLVQSTIEDSEIAPLDSSWVVAIFRFVPRPLCLQFPDKLKEFTYEVNRQYLTSVKRSIIDYVLLDFEEQKRLGVEILFEEDESAGRFFFPWHNSVRKTKLWMEKELYITHPVARVILDLWETKFSGLRLIDVNKLSELMPLNITVLKTEVEKSIIEARRVLQRDWLPKVSELISGMREEVEKWMSSDKEQRCRQMEHFFCSVASLLSSQLRSVIFKTMEDLLNLLEGFSDGNEYEGEYETSNMRYKNLHPPLLISMIPDEDNESTKFNPTFDETVETVSTLLDHMILATEGLIRVEHSLFYPVEGQGQRFLPTVNVEEDAVVEAKERIGQIVKLNEPGPIKFREVYERFKYLLAKDTDGKVQRFIKRDPTLSGYVKEIDGLKSMANKAMSSFVSVPMGLFLVDCTEINEWLVSRANQLIAKMVDTVAETNRQVNRDICHKFDQIVEKVTAVKTTTRDLVAQQDYCEQLRIRDLVILSDELEASGFNLMFLLEHTFLSKDDLILNATSFSWPERILPIVRNSELRIMKERDAALDKLRSQQKDFTARLNATLQQVKDFRSKERMGEAERYVSELQQIDESVKQYEEEKEQINKEELLLETGMQTSYGIIMDIVNQKDPYERLWTTAMSFSNYYDKWMNGPILNVNAEVVDEEVQQLWKNSYRLTKIFAHPDFIGPMRAAVSIKGRLEKFKVNMPLLQALGNPGLKGRHWAQMTKKVGIDLAPKKDTPLNEYLQMGLEKHLEDLNAISSQASKEYAVEKALEKMKKQWESMEFAFTSYKDTGIPILNSIDDIQVLLDDHIVKSATMKGSPFIGPFEDEIMQWDVTLHRMKGILETWLSVQSSWLYLEPIFGSEDIRRQIPLEGGQFENVHNAWDGWEKINSVLLRIMSSSKFDNSALKVLAIPRMLEDLSESEMLLEQIQKGLNKYLEEKRLYFPRFFFLSNDELLEILSETQDPARVQPHLKKCFEGITRLGFDNDGTVITAIESSEGERVSMSTSIDTRRSKGLVEKWLLEVQTEMQKSLQSVMRKSTISYANCDRTQWVMRWPGQIVLSASQIHWTAEAVKALEQNRLKWYHDKLTKQIEAIVTMVRGRLNTMARITLESLIVIDVHARDVVAKLWKSGTNDQTDFNWISQLRYYMVDGYVRVRMITTEVPYCYEYLGNTSRLVITPLTDRVYRTLFGALKLNLGSAPEGPAGTGKTETSKDLAKAVAKQCVVFNCSDGLDYKAMGKFFKGLAQSGAWACFDEFNRIDLEVLSVIAQQIQSIQRAIGEQKTVFNFEGTDIKLDKTCTIFITMNPGYKGRAELPDNLKVLFRSVAMMIPDYAMIAEISLYSMGFIDARVLAGKIIAVYRLSSEQLSAQHHYDYGMRAVKAVLYSAGRLKLQFPEENEAILVLRSINDVNLPKFLSADLPLFHGIILDLFPGISAAKPDRPSVETAVNTACKNFNLQPVPWFVEKVMQEFDMMKVRHGFMIVGETMGGKTSSFKVLARAFQLLCEYTDGEEQPVDFEIINPKSITLAQLYGSFDSISHEWSDGVLANIFRQHSQAIEDDKRRKWIVFDGPVDASWIENMNTVLDDNKKLCLMSGEIIQMSSQQNMIFEPQDLEQASPATASRCGMIYMEPSELGWQPLLRMWFDNNLPEQLSLDHKNMVRLCADWLIHPCLKFVQKECQMVIKQSNQQLVGSLIRLYSSFMQQIRDTYIQAEDQDEVLESEDSMKDEEASKKQAYKELKMQLLEEEERLALCVCQFLFSIIWGIGGCLQGPSKEKFGEFFKSICDSDERAKNNPKTILQGWWEPKDLKFPRHLLIPKRGSVYDYVFVKKSYGSWHKWEVMMETTELDEKTKAAAFRAKVEAKRGVIAEIIIETVDTVRQRYFLQKMLESGIPMGFIGPTGTGKSAIINHFLLTLPETKYILNTINFSAQTTANVTQEMVMSRLEKKARGMYAPPERKRMLLFVDDLNMPTREKFGAMPPIELLRQLIDHKFWFEKKETNKICIDGVHLFTALGLPGGGRNDVSQRLMRHIQTLALDDFSEDTIKTIFGPLLEWHFNIGFDNVLRRFARLFVFASCDLYMRTIKTFFPTPAKCHYIFNLRDIARLMQGFLMFKSDSVRDVSGQNEANYRLIRLWIHEVYRVFFDRLVDDLDRTKAFEIVNVVVRTHFKERLNNVLSHLLTAKDCKDSDLRGLFFGDYLSLKEGQGRSYSEVTDIAKLHEAMEVFLEEYNMNSKAPMDLVMFNFAIEHISRIVRVLKQPKGHLLLIGIGGSGRSSATRLATYMAMHTLYDIKISQNYGTADWREDIRKVLKIAGEQGNSVVLMFGDHQIKDQSFLEDINILLNSADIPNLYEHEDRLEIIEKMQQVALAEKLKVEMTPLNMYNKFLERVRINLHIVLTFSPIGEAFRNRLRMVPSLISCCTIDWFQAWPEDALEKVATRYLDDVEMNPEVRKEVTHMCKQFHQDVRQLSDNFKEVLHRFNYVTPTSYLQLIKTFKRLLDKKRLEILTLKNRYQVGLQKLEFAETQVAIMSEELKDLQPQLIQTSKETEDLMGVIQRDTEEVEKVKNVVEEDEEVANRAAAESQSIKDECEEQLNIALPALNAAVAALNTLKEQDISLVKTMANPPQGIKIVLEAICIMKGMKPTRKPDANGKMIDDYWPTAKKMLGDLKFLDSLKEYDKDNIGPGVMKQIRDKYISNPEFDPARIRNASSACEGMCLWIKAIEVYDRVIKVIAPKRERLGEAEKKLGEQMEMLEVKQKELQEVTSKLDALRHQFQEKNDMKTYLESQIDLTQVRLQRASKLIGQLGGERVRWTEMEKLMGSSYINIVGDVLIASAIVAYLGPFTLEFRNSCVNKWLGECRERSIPVSPHFDLAGTLCDPVTSREWQLRGLPVDDFSLDNAILVKNSSRWPLMIDPQSQANKWIKNMERVNKLMVVKLSDTDYLRTLENCITFGAPCLIENVGEELDPVLDPVLLKQTFKQTGDAGMAGAEYIRLRDNVFQFSKDFRLYMTTRILNPHYLPEVSVKVTIINFMITREALENQLLNLVAAMEEPELEEKRNQLITEGAMCKRQLKEIEDKILEILSASQGNILEDDAAIEVLTSSKCLSEELQVKETTSEETQESISQVRNKYIPVSVHSALMFFVSTSLTSIDPMYQFSLDFYIKLFVQTLEKTNQKNNLEKRMHFLNRDFTFSLYQNVCRSLFEKDKLLFSFLLTVSIIRGKGWLTDGQVNKSDERIEDQELRFLLTGSVTLDNPYPNPCSDWLSEKTWNEICKAAELPRMTGFKEHFERNYLRWKKMFEAADPSSVMPDGWKPNQLTDIQTLIITRCFRPDKITSAVIKFVVKRMGKEYVDPPTFDLEKSFIDSNCSTPLVFVLSPGSDPMASLQKFADAKGQTLITISLGQGQGPIAEKKVKDAAASGHWVVLQNCHLAVSWLPTLEKLVQDQLSNSQLVKPHFRMWLTSYTSEKFPAYILQTSVKMTNEPPKGLRNNILRSYLSHPINNPDFYRGCRKSIEWQRLLFSLTFFHALVQERRDFGPLGWNISYMFNESDLIISVRQLQMFLNDYEKIPIDALLYLVGECNYGGRVTDERDRVLINSLLTIFYNHKVYQEPGYRFSSNSASYYIPDEAREHAAFVDYVKQLPIQNDPTVFGLHENADIAKANRETKELFEGVLKTLPKEGNVSPIGSTENALILTKDILGKLPVPFKVEEVAFKFPVQYDESMNTVLLQELTRYNRLIAVIKSSLQEMEKAILGYVVQSAAIEEVFNSVLIGRVPLMWKEKSYPSTKPLASYIIDLIHRIEFFKTWSKQGQPNVFWLSGFFFTQSFFTGALQNYARAHKIPIDHLGFNYEVIERSENQIEARPSKGVYVSGLFLEGAAWDHEKWVLTESTPKELYVKMPVMWVIPRMNEDASSSSQYIYKCPIYKTGLRKGELSTTGHSTNFVLAAELPTDKSHVHWINRGVALLCQLDD
ncbi:dynein axonemal heavy chain 3-like [Symsagittifera roscoffensis]|uniref:dynein axonemal heavy chain 3-like n=1 Tax=Symsagittifera roscoffensis TaxID=84072 RepID=UPI00307C6607